MIHNYKAYFIPCRVGFQDNLKNIKNSNFFSSENHLQTLLYFIKKLGVN